MSINLYIATIHINRHKSEIRGFKCYHAIAVFTHHMHLLVRIPADTALSMQIIYIMNVCDNDRLLVSISLMNNYYAISCS